MKGIQVWSQCLGENRKGAILPQTMEKRRGSDEQEYGSFQKEAQLAPRGGLNDLEEPDYGDMSR